MNSVIGTNIGYPQTQVVQQTQQFGVMSGFQQRPIGQSVVSQVQMRPTQYMQQAPRISVAQTQQVQQPFMSQQPQTLMYSQAPPQQQIQYQQAPPRQQQYQQPQVQPTYLLLNNASYGWIGNYEEEEEDDDDDEEEEVQDKKSKPKSKPKKKKAEKRKSAPKVNKVKPQKRKSAVRVREQAARPYIAPAPAPQQTFGGEIIHSTFKTGDNFQVWLDQNFQQMYNVYSKNTQPQHITVPQFMQLQDDVAQRIGVNPPPRDFVTNVLASYEIPQDAKLDVRTAYALTYIIYWMYFVEYYHLKQQDAPQRAYELYLSILENDLLRYIYQICDKMFLWYDGNGNGLVDKRELLQMIIDLENELKMDHIEEKEVADAFLKFDVTKDQNFNAEEFTNFIQQFFIPRYRAQMQKQAQAQPQAQPQAQTK
eukprot:TRINITY_DN1028_c0_g1_i6.p1 TRINITY_DN1028_c0_g1~~TRINITY_DN1028_c0_g1_i6.p1  ORF type:complete len:422 (+),score=53.97 TRINITY_DN1028_c0_g1_i6:112-1377(+)